MCFVLRCDARAVLCHLGTATLLFLFKVSEVVADAETTKVADMKETENEVVMARSYCLSTVVAWEDV